MNGFTSNGLVRNRFGHPSFPRKRESRGPRQQRAAGARRNPLGPRLRGDDELSSKLFARHYTSRGQTYLRRGSRRGSLAG
jgi:hypothetical protein